MTIVSSKDEYNDFCPILSRYRTALQRLEAWGISLPPNSRLRAYEARLAEADAISPGPVTPEFAIQFIVDLREIDELITITSSFPDPPTANELQLLRRLVGGKEHPDDEQMARAREAQFELVIRSLLKDRGLAVTVGEPDLTIHVSGLQYSLEAKRPGSAARFDDRLREGCGQVAARGVPGIVAVSMDEVLRPPGTFLVVKDREMLGLSINGLLREYVEQNKRAIAKRVSGKHVAALLFTATLPAKDETTSLSLLGANHHLEIIASQDTPGYALVEAFRRVFAT